MQMTTQNLEPARATLEDNEAENSYPPVGTPETAIVVVIDSENFKILAHTGRYFHGTCVCAGYTGEESGLCGVPDEPGFYFFYDGKVWTSQCWETGIVDDWGIEGSFRKATPEDFLTAGLECPLDLREQNKSTDLYTAACAERDALRDFQAEIVRVYFDPTISEIETQAAIHRMMTEAKDRVRQHEKHKAGE